MASAAPHYAVVVMKGRANRASRDARVDRIELGRVPEIYSQALAKIASQLVRTQFDDKPFHTFRDEDFRKFGIGYEPLALSVRNDALVLTLRVAVA